MKAVFSFYEGGPIIPLTSRELACDNLLVLTWDEESVEEVQGKKIRYLPVWRWLIERKL